MYYGLSGWKRPPSGSQEDSGGSDGAGTDRQDQMALEKPLQQFPAVEWK